MSTWAEWVEVLEHMSKSMMRLVMSARVELKKTTLGVQKCNRDWQGWRVARLEVAVHSPMD